MRPQRLFLKLMLWLLAASAAAGVLAIFLSTQVMGRVAGTALVGAIATGLAMAVSRMLDDEKKRLGGLVGLGTIVVSLVLGLAAIWVELGFWGDLDWQFALSAVLTCIAGLLACYLHPRTGTPAFRPAAWVALATDVAALAFLLGGVWVTEEEPMLTAAFLLASGPAAAVALVGVGIEGRPWRWIGVLAAVVALAMGITGTWFIKSDNPSPYVITMVIAVVVAHANIVMRVPLGDSAIWARPAAIGSTGAAGACVCALTLITGGFDTDGPEALTRLAGALGIVSACSTVAIVVLYRLHRRPPGTSAEVAAIASVQVVCPHCGRKHTAPVGESACAACGLLITVKVREPRCVTCDYPLLDLPGGVCPECGTARQRVGPGASS